MRQRPANLPCLLRTTTGTMICIIGTPFFAIVNGSICQPCRFWSDKALRFSFIFQHKCLTTSRHVSDRGPFSALTVFTCQQNTVQPQPPPRSVAIDSRRSGSLRILKSLMQPFRRARGTPQWLSSSRLVKILSATCDVHLFPASGLLGLKKFNRHNLLRQIGMTRHYALCL